MTTPARPSPPARPPGRRRAARRRRLEDEVARRSRSAAGPDRGAGGRPRTRGLVGRQAGRLEHGRVREAGVPAAPAIRPQFGSRPWTAALTRLLETTARATARASASSAAPGHLAGDQRRGALAVGGLLAGEVARDRLDRLARGPAASRPGRDLAAPAAPEASTKTVSFVLVSPSTESWSHVRAAAGRRRPEHRGRPCVGQDDGQHRRHPRVDHPDALGDAGDAYRRPAPVGVGQRRRSWSRPWSRESVVRSASAAASRAASVARERPGRASAMPGGDLSSGRRVPMIPVERCSVRGSVPSAVGEERRDRGLILFAGRSRRGVRAAARRDDRAPPSRSRPADRIRRSEMGPREPDRRRGERVRREDRGRRGRPVRRRDEARSGRPEALMPAATPPARNPRRDPARRSTAGRRRKRRDASEVTASRGHRGYGASGSCSRPAVSGSPWTRLNAWTAWPRRPSQGCRSTPIARIRPVRWSRRTWTRAWLLPVTCFVAGGAATTRTNGSPA